MFWIKWVHEIYRELKNSTAEEWGKKREEIYNQEDSDESIHDSFKGI